MHLEEISLERPKVLAGIAAAQPYTMHWSNVCDFLPTCKAFHRLARACSMEDTVYFANSLNWIRYVHGVFLLDVQTMVGRGFPSLQDVIMMDQVYNPKQAEKLRMLIIRGSA